MASPNTTPTRMPVKGYLIVSFNCPMCGRHDVRDEFGRYDCGCGAKLDVMEAALVEP